MQFETRKLADLRPAEYNPRKKLTPEDPEYIQLFSEIVPFNKDFGAEPYQRSGKA